MVKNLMRLEGRLIRVSAAGGLELEGFADTYPSGYGLHEFGREEESIRLRGFQLFEEDILRIEELGVRRYYKHFDKLTPDELYAIMKARVDVFVVEQRCPYAELDGLDQDAIHVWLEDENGLAAYLRVLRPGVENENMALGRILTLRRGRGLGRLIVQAGIDVAEGFYDSEYVYLEAQTCARGFYEKLGFHQASEEFVLDGIPHIRMLRATADDDFLAED